jgi:hypothetical protein
VHAELLLLLLLAFFPFKQAPNEMLLRIERKANVNI